MLSPTPFSLLCALLLCLPLTIIFTITTPLTPSSTISGGGATLSSTVVIDTTEINSVHIPINLSSTSSSGGSAVSSPKTLTFTRKKTKINSHPTLLASTSTSTASSSGRGVSATLSSTKTKINSRPTLQSDIKTHQNPKTKNLTKTTTSPHSPPPSPPPPPLPRVKRRVSSHLHELNDDDSLLQLAARVNSNPKPPRRKVAFMFLTTTPLPFAPLWEAFFNHTPKNLYNIYVHADPSFNYSPPFQGVFTHRVIPSKPTRRHSPTLASAARRLLAHALLHDKSNYMFALLSAACIPIHSFNFTYKVLTQSKKSFIEILGDEPGAYERWAARGEDVMLPEVKFEDFRIGSQFFVLKRQHARAVARDRRLWSKFNLPCLHRHTCYPEEHYFPTLLNTVDPHGCVPTTLTHVDWSDSSEEGHPRMYYPEEVSPELMWTIRSMRPRYGDDPINGSDSSVTKRHDPFLFARKFSPDCLEPLMSIADDVMFKD